MSKKTPQVQKPTGIIEPETAEASAVLYKIIHTEVSNNKHIVVVTDNGSKEALFNQIKSRK